MSDLLVSAAGMTPTFGGAPLARLQAARYLAVGESK